MADIARKIIDRIEERRRAAAARATVLSAARKKPSRRSMPFARLHRAIVRFEPYGIILAVFGLILTFGTIILDLEDQQSERIFKAWEILALDHENINNSSAKRQALEFLNRRYEGLFCSPTIVTPIVELLNGNQSRKCLIPSKSQEGFHYLNAQNTFLERVALPRAKLHRANFNKANLYKADLSRAQLVFADLIEAQLIGANLNDANLSGADLTATQLVGANLTDADLTGVNLNRAGLVFADLIRATLIMADLTAAELIGANLTDADLTGANLSKANLTNADLTGANLEGTVLWLARGLTEQQLRSACGVPATLSPGLPSPPPCPE